MDRHAELLKNLCRSCGKTIKCEKSRKPKDIKDFIEIAKQLNIFVTEDSPTVHPTKLCESCRKVFIKIDSAIKNNKDYHPSLQVFQFTPHLEGECTICMNDSSKKVVGRSRALKQVNQYSETPHCVGGTSSVDKPKEHEHLQSNNGFHPLSLKDFAESLGFAMVNSDDLSVMYTIFVRRDSPFLQIRNLLTVTITSDCHWKVHLDDKDVTSEEIFCSFSETVDENSLKSILSLCTKSVLCCGNEDFVELCESRREEGNKVIFKDRKDKEIARECYDVICMALGLEATIRHNSCRMLLTTKNQQRCEVCTLYRATLCALNSKIKNGNLPLAKRDIEISASSSIPNKHYSNQQLKSKLGSRKNENQSLRRENKQLRAKIKNLIENEGVKGGKDLHDTLKKTLNEKISSKAKDFQFPEGSAMQILFDEQLKTSKLSSAKQMRWHPLVIRWCLGIYHTSPAAYDFIKRSSFLKLPHKNTLRDYTLYTEPGSGFNADVLARLYEEAGVEKMEPHQRNISLLFDEMKIKADLVYNKTTGRLVGFVALDKVKNEIENLERICAEEAPEKEIATHVMAVMVRGIYTNLLFTIAYFPTKAITCDVIFPIAWNAVCSLESIGLCVRCFVSDGASSNRKFYKLHLKPGSKELPYFAINLCNKSRKIYLICDVPHLIKTVRNNWENSHGNRNSRNLIVSIL